MPRRDRSPRAIADRLCDRWQDREPSNPLALRYSIACAIHHERLRARRIVQRELAWWDQEYADGRTGAGTVGRMAACHNILAALKEGE